MGEPASNAADTETAIGRKVVWRIVIPCAFYILLGAIDRANVGFAALQMNAELGLDGKEYGLAAGILFVGYLVAKVPSVLLYEAVGMRRWLAAITLAWGLCSSAMSLVETHAQLYALRTMIGFAEGGLSSGLMIYLSQWASERFRARVLALPILSISLAQVIGAPLSGWLLEAGNPLGWPGWRWMFLIEGLPAVLLALFAWVHFPDSPAEARFLSADERGWLAANVVGAPRRRRGERVPGRWDALRSPVAWLCAFIWFCILAGSYGVMFWLPQIVRGMAGLTAAETGVVVALPWAFSGLGLILNARHSDATRERYLHVAVPALVAAAGLLGAYLIGPKPAGLVVLVIGAGCTGSMTAAFWAIPTRLLAPGALAMGIVAINIVGSFAGLLVPLAMGALKDATGAFLAPTLLLVGIELLLAALCLVARRLDRA